jgi:hypothetical protein
MSVKIGTPKIAYGKTVIFDTPGNHTFIHPSPGKNLQAFVEIFGGGGGSQVTSGVATDGGNTIWNTSGSPITVDGGSGGDVAADTTTGLAGKGLYKRASSNTGGNSGLLCTNGDNHYGASVGASYTGNVGDVKRFDTTITGNIGITVGAGGTGNTGNGKSGAVIIHYNVLDNEVPVTVSNTPEVDHYLEFSWRTDVNAPSQELAPQAINTLWLDTEVLDTGNYGSVTGGSNTFSLDAGTYEFEVFVPLYDGSDSSVQSNTIMLWNETDGQLERSSLSPTTFDSYSNVGHIPFKGVIKIASTKSFSLKFQSSDNAANADYFVGPEYAFNPTTGTHDRTRIILTRKAYS